MSLAKINENVLIVALASVLATIGGKHVCADLNGRCIDFLKGPMMRKLILLSIIFLYTKNIKVAFLTMLVYLIVVKGLFGENDDDDDESKGQGDNNGDNNEKQGSGNNKKCEHCGK